VSIEAIKEEPVKEVKKNAIKSSVGSNRTPVKPGIPGVSRNGVKKWIIYSIDKIEELQQSIYFSECVNSILDVILFLFYFTLILFGRLVDQLY